MAVGISSDTRRSSTDSNQPPARPITPPPIISRANNVAPFSQVAHAGSTMRWATKMVRKMDIGSLSPDSTSNNAVMRSGNARRARPSNATTAAASVGATAAPTSMACANGTPATHVITAATTTAVMPTPITASTNAGQSARRSIGTPVCRPP